MVYRWQNFLLGMALTYEQIRKTIVVCTRVAIPLSAGATSSSNGSSADSNGFTVLSTAFPLKSSSCPLGNGVGTEDSRGGGDIVLERTRVAIQAGPAVIDNVK